MYRNLDWFEKWQSGNGNIAWSYQCPTVIFDRLLAFRCLIQQWIVPAEDKREKNWTINHLWYHNISSIFLEYTDVPPTSLLSHWAKTILKYNFEILDHWASMAMRIKSEKIQKSKHAALLDFAKWFFS